MTWSRRRGQPRSEKAKKVERKLTSFTSSLRRSGTQTNTGTAVVATKHTNDFKVFSAKKFEGMLGAFSLLPPFPPQISADSSFSFPHRPHTTLSVLRQARRPHSHPQSCEVARRSRLESGDDG